MCTAGNVGGTGNSAGASASSDNLGIPCWFIPSLIVLEDSAIRVVRPSRLKSLVGSILLSRTNFGMLRISGELSMQKSSKERQVEVFMLVQLVSTCEVSPIFAKYSITRTKTRNHATI